MRHAKTAYTASQLFIASKRAAGLSVSFLLMLMTSIVILSFFNVIDIVIYFQGKFVLE